MRNLETVGTAMLGPTDAVPTDVAETGHPVL